MKKLITKILLFIICFMSFTSLVNARNNQITIDDIVAYTKAALENVKDSDGKYKYTKVNAYADNVKKMIEVEFIYQDKEVKTGIQYDENLNINPGVHTLLDAMNAASDDHANCTLDTAIDILIIFMPKNNKLFANFVNYTEEDINKYFDNYFDENNKIENGYEKYTDETVCTSDNCYLINFNNFTLGRDVAAPKLECIKNNNNIILKNSVNVEDDTIIHIYRSLDNINFEKYNDVTIKNNSAELILKEAADTNYYYKSVVEGSNNWSEVVKYENETSDKDTSGKDTVEKEPDKPTENPKTGSKEIISIVLIVGITLLIAYNYIKKNDKINNI